MMMEERNHLIMKAQELNHLLEQSRKRLDWIAYQRLFSQLIQTNIEIRKLTETK